MDASCSGSVQAEATQILDARRARGQQVREQLRADLERQRIALRASKAEAKARARSRGIEPRFDDLFLPVESEPGSHADLPNGPTPLLLAQVSYLLGHMQGERPIEKASPSRRALLQAYDACHERATSGGKFCALQRLWPDEMFDETVRTSATVHIYRALSGDNTGSLEELAEEVQAIAWWRDAQRNEHMPFAFNGWLLQAPTTADAYMRWLDEPPLSAGSNPLNGASPPSAETATFPTAPSIASGGWTQLSRSRPGQILAAVPAFYAPADDFDPKGTSIKRYTEHCGLATASYRSSTLAHPSTVFQRRGWEMRPTDDGRVGPGEYDAWDGKFHKSLSRGVHDPWPAAVDRRSPPRCSATFASTSARSSGTLTGGPAHLNATSLGGPRRTIRKVVDHLSSATYARLREVFDRFDQDNRGFLDYHRLLRALANCGVQVVSKGAHRTLHLHLEQPPRGKVDFEGFASLVADLMGGITRLNGGLQVPESSPAMQRSRASFAATQRQGRAPKHDHAQKGPATYAKSPNSSNSSPAVAAASTSSPVSPSAFSATLAHRDLPLSSTVGIHSGPATPFSGRKSSPGSPEHRWARHMQRQIDESEDRGRWAAWSETQSVREQAEQCADHASTALSHSEVRRQDAERRLASTAAHWSDSEVRRSDAEHLAEFATAAWQSSEAKLAAERKRAAVERRSLQDEVAKAKRNAHRIISGRSLSPFQRAPLLGTPQASAPQQQLAASASSQPSPPPDVAQSPPSRSPPLSRSTPSPSKWPPHPQPSAPASGTSPSDHVQNIFARFQRNELVDQQDLVRALSQFGLDISEDDVRAISMAYGARLNGLDVHEFAALVSDVEFGLSTRNGSLNAIAAEAAGLSLSPPLSSRAKPVASLPKSAPPPPQPPPPQAPAPQSPRPLSVAATQPVLQQQEELAARDRKIADLERAVATLQAQKDPPLATQAASASTPVWWQSQRWCLCLPEFLI